jgi:hypothetical protein
MAMTSRGPQLVYRDRSANEVRDVEVAAPVADAHGALVHADGWHLTGCPVNGPRIDARGAHAAVAWYTAADGKAAVNLAVSRDGGATFSAPLHVDAGHPAGRVDLALLDDGSAVVTWVETGGKGANVVARRVKEDGSLDKPLLLGSGASPASIGFPRMAFSKENILAAWNGDDGVHVAMIKSQKR